jgi:hypothetical protein
MEQLHNPLWNDMDQFPDIHQLPKNTLFLTGAFVSHVSGCVLWSNGNVQYKYLFPKIDGALSNCKRRRIDLSIPLESKHNTLRWFLSTAVQLSAPSTQTLTDSSLQNSLSHLPRRERINRQFPICRYNANYLSSYLFTNLSIFLSVYLLIFFFCAPSYSKPSMIDS